MLKIISILAFVLISTHSYSQDNCFDILAKIAVLKEKKRMTWDDEIIKAAFTHIFEKHSNSKGLTREDFIKSLDEEANTLLSEFLQRDIKTQALLKAAMRSSGKKSWEEVQNHFGISLSYRKDITWNKEKLKETFAYIFSRHSNPSSLTMSTLARSLDDEATKLLQEHVGKEMSTASLALATSKVLKTKKWDVVKKELELNNNLTKEKLTKILHYIYKNHSDPSVITYKVLKESSDKEVNELISRYLKKDVRSFIISEKINEFFNLNTIDWKSIKARLGVDDVYNQRIFKELGSERVIEALEYALKNHSHIEKVSRKVFIEGANKELNLLISEKLGINATSKIVRSIESNVEHAITFWKILKKYSANKLRSNETFLSDDKREKIFSYFLRRYSKGKIINYSTLFHGEDEQANKVLSDLISRDVTTRIFFPRTGRIIKNEEAYHNFRAKVFPRLNISFNGVEYNVLKDYYLKGYPKEFAVSENREMLFLSYEKQLGRKLSAEDKDKILKLIPNELISLLKVSKDFRPAKKHLKKLMKDQGYPKDFHILLNFKILKSRFEQMTGKTFSDKTFKDKHLSELVDEEDLNLYTRDMRTIPELEKRVLKELKIAFPNFKFSNDQKHNYTELLYALRRVLDDNYSPSTSRMTDWIYKLGLKHSDFINKNIRASRYNLTVKKKYEAFVRMLKSHSNPHGLNRYLLTKSQPGVYVEVNSLLKEFTGANLKGNIIKDIEEDPIYTLHLWKFLKDNDLDHLRSDKNVWSKTLVVNAFRYILRNHPDAHRLKRSDLSLSRDEKANELLSEYFSKDVKTNLLFSNNKLRNFGLNFLTIRNKELAKGIYIPAGGPLDRALTLYRSDGYPKEGAYLENVKQFESYYARQLGRKELTKEESELIWRVLSPAERELLSKKNNYVNVKKNLKERIASFGYPKKEYILENYKEVKRLFEDAIGEEISDYNFTYNHLKDLINIEDRKFFLKRTNVREHSDYVRERYQEFLQDNPITYDQEENMKNFSAFLARTFSPDYGIGFIQTGMWLKNLELELSDYFTSDSMIDAVEFYESLRLRGGSKSAAHETTISFSHDREEFELVNDYDTPEIKVIEGQSLRTGKDIVHHLEIDDPLIMKIVLIIVDMKVLSIEKISEILLMRHSHEEVTSAFKRISLDDELREILLSSLQ